MTKDGGEMSDKLDKAYAQGVHDGQRDGFLDDWLEALSAMIPWCDEEAEEAYRAGYEYGVSHRSDEHGNRYHTWDGKGVNDPDDEEEEERGREQIEKVLAGSEHYDRGYDRGKDAYGKDPDKVTHRRRTSSSRSSKTSRTSSGGGGGGLLDTIGGWFVSFIMIAVIVGVVASLLHWVRYNTPTGLKYEKAVTKYHKAAFSLSENQGRVYKFDIDTDTETEFLYGRNMAFSPDGKKLAIISKDERGERTWVGDTDGTNLRYIEKTDDFYWSGDGKHLLYKKEWRKENGFGYVDVWDRDNQYIGTGSKEVIGDFALSLKQDVAYVAKGDYEDSVHLTRTNSNVWKTPPLFVGKNIKIIGWSADAKYLTVSVNKTVVVLKVTGERCPRYRPELEVAEQLTDGLIGFHWCPIDSGKAVVSVADEIMIFTPAKKQLRWVTSGISPKWSPDGKKIAFLSSGGLYFIYSTDYGTRRTLAKNVREFTWGPNSNALYFHKR